MHQVELSSFGGYGRQPWAARSHHYRLGRCMAVEPTRRHSETKQCSGVHSTHSASDQGYEGSVVLKFLVFFLNETQCWK